jgi:putative ABC transport system permease protein
VTAEVGLLAAFLGCLGFALYIAVTRPLLRRLAIRQVSRRPAEAFIVVLGSLLGTSLIVASLVVGDSLDRSVRQTAYDVLGPIDETVRASSDIVGQQAVDRMAAIRRDPAFDGLLVARQDVSAATRGEGAGALASPKVVVTELSFPAASRFGGPGASGLDVADPGPQGVVLNTNLADALDVAVGDRVTFYLYAKPTVFTVRSVVPARGLAGSGLGAAANEDAFFAPGVLRNAAADAHRDLSTVVFVSNPGGVESGVEGTARAVSAIDGSLGDLRARGAQVSTPKKEVLDAADRTGKQLGSLFLFIASFSIIAGILLLVNVFVMLTDERKGQLGMLRAMGLRRRRLTAELALEGTAYGLVAAVLGAGLGILLGRLVVVLAVNILNSYQRGDNKITLVFRATSQSLVTGTTAGFVIAFVAVVLTSIRIARMNIIGAIRDLPPDMSRPPRRGLVWLSVLGTAVFALAAVPALRASQGVGTYLLPAAAVLAAVPWLRRLLPIRTVMTWVAIGILLWGLTANLVRPHMYDDASSATYTVLGSMLSFAAVVLISLHQDVLLRPLRPVIGRPGQTGLAARLSVTYPTARAFRTGATLAMYCIVVLVIVLLAQIAALINAGVDSAVRDASGGWTLRADFNAATPLEGGGGTLATTTGSGIVRDAPLVTATGLGTDPRQRWTTPLLILAVGYGNDLLAGRPTLESRLPQLRSDAAAWQLPLTDPSYVLVDEFYGASGGPPGAAVHAGDAITLTDPRTGERSRRVVAGILRDGSAFYGASAGEFRFPVLMSAYSAQSLFGVDARPTSVLLRTSRVVDRHALEARMQSEYLANGLAVTDIEDAIRASYTANTQMFRLMQGYLATGLLVAIAGLGVVMVRSVRERRRTIGVLRALGVQSSTVRRAFLAESIFIALEGVAVGTTLGVLTTWLLYRNSAAFASLHTAFPIAWGQISLTVSLALVASLLATVVPARRAAAVRPAIAVRVAE